MIRIHSQTVCTCFGGFAKDLGDRRASGKKGQGLVRIHAEGFPGADYLGLEYVKSLKGRKAAQEGSHLLSPHQAPEREQGTET